MSIFVTQHVEIGAETLKKVYGTIELQQDFDIAIEALTEAHPALFEHVTKEELKNKIAAARERLKRSMTELEFYRAVAPVFAAVSCYHTNLRPSTDTTRAFNASAQLLPLGILIRDSRVYITHDYSDAKQICPGARLLAINGVAVEKIIETLAKDFPQNIDGDGIERRHARLAQPGYFARALSIQFGLSSPYTINIAAPEAGSDRAITVPGLPVAELEKCLPPRNLKPTLAFLDAGASALLTIPSFQEDNDFESFLRDSFRSLRQRGTKNLIVDLRQNGGGEDLYGPLLYSYLSAKAFRYYASLEARADRFRAARYATEFPAEAFKRRLVKGDAGKFLVRQDQHRGLQLQQPKTDRFAGKVFCLVGIQTGSAATEFGAVAQSEGRAVFIGEETGGGYSMDSSGTTLDVILPNTHAHAFVPTVRYNVAVKPRNPHRGIVTDARAEPSVEDVIVGIDRPLAKARALIGLTAN
jgi:hypothetical protein